MVKTLLIFFKPIHFEWVFYFYDIFINKNIIMKKIIRLTESDLVRIVKRVIKEDTGSCPKDVLDFQKWMNTNKKFWYKGQFNINKENTEVWGICESETKKAWMKYKDAYLGKKSEPKIPTNLGFAIVDSPIGKVVNWKSGQPDSENPIANTNIAIKPGAKINIVKKGQVQIEGYLYFRKEKGKVGEKSVFSGSGPESNQAILGQFIKKTIWYDCATSSFYLWYDSNKVEYSFYGNPKFNKFTETEEWIGNNVCGYATQDEMIAQFKG